MQSFWTFFNSKSNTQNLHTYQTITIINLPGEIQESKSTSLKKFYGKNPDSFLNQLFQFSVTLQFRMQECLNNNLQFNLNMPTLTGSGWFFFTVRDVLRNKNAEESQWKVARHYLQCNRMTLLTHSKLSSLSSQLEFFPSRNMTCQNRIYSLDGQNSACSVHRTLADCYHSNFLITQQSFVTKLHQHKTPKHTISNVLSS